MDTVYNKCEVLCHNRAYVARHNLKKTGKTDLEGKKVCSGFKSNSCNIIFASSIEVIFMKIYCLLIYLNHVL